MRGKIRIQKRGGQKQKIKIHYLLMVIAILASAVVMPRTNTQAEGCPDLRVVFARGSGGERWQDQNYLAFKAGIENKLSTVDLNYEFIDLDYPAVGIDNLEVIVGAAVGSGDAYEFGASVDTGVANLKDMVNSPECENTKYVVGGYSQGAMVISKALPALNSKKLIYAATFGDPKIYLPEGEGLMPAACRGEGLSDYRMYVPDCQAFKGLLGAHIPYEPDDLTGKVGTWCNKRDVFCSSHFNIIDHIGYVADNLYEDASKVIFAKIAAAFELKNRVSSPHDTAFLIDSTWSMIDMINEYKAEAMRLATETWESGGRVALFDYRDLDDPYDLVQHCDFESCTLEKFQQELENINLDGGGDSPESLLSASFHAMQTLNWKRGSTKSLVILTDAGFVSPDRDGITLDKVVELSRRIDPVNFYIITNEESGGEYAELARATDGKVETDFDKLNLLTNYIMERYDSLPRVEEMAAPTELPKIEVVDVSQTTGLTMDATVKFTNTGTRAIVILNDYVLGVIPGTEVTVTGLDASQPNVMTLVPLTDEVRGEAVVVPLVVGGFGEHGKKTLNNTNGASSVAPENLGAPATGKL